MLFFSGQAGHCAGGSLCGEEERGKRKEERKI
jgi:hypothetical protein